MTTEHTEQRTLTLEGVEHTPAAFDWMLAETVVKSQHPWGDLYTRHENGVRMAYVQHEGQWYRFSYDEITPIRQAFGKT